MFLDDRLLACFCAAAEELHFGRAAARLFMSQPPFSQQIKRLETLVGARLFLRTTRSVRLTPAGEVMYRHVAALAGQTCVMLREVQQAARGEGGSLVVGIAPTAAYSPVADALYRYRVAHPEVTLDLREMNSVTMEAMLRANTIDVAVMRPMPMDAAFDRFEVFREPMMLALRRDHAWAGRGCVTVEEAAALPLIGYSQQASPYFRGMLQGMFAHAGTAPRIVQESVIPTVLTLVEIGVGAAIVPRSLSRLRSDSLAFLPVQDPSNAMATIVVATLRQRSNQTVDHFVAALQQADRAPERKAKSRRMGGLER
jgi:DNA-binding transcriptional LysR family regulator